MSEKAQARMIFRQKMLALTAGFSILLVDMKPTTNKVRPVRDLPPTPIDGNESRPMKAQSNSKEIPNSSDSDHRLVLLLGKAFRWLAAVAAASAALYSLFAYVITVEGMPFHWRLIAGVGVWLACDIYGLRFKHNASVEASPNTK